MDYPYPDLRPSLMQEIEEEPESASEKSYSLIGDLLGDDDSLDSEMQPDSAWSQAQDFVYRIAQDTENNQN